MEPKDSKAPTDMSGECGSADFRPSDNSFFRDQMKLFIVVILSFIFKGGPAQAYVRTTTSHGTPLSWRRSCIFITPDSSGSSDLTPSHSIMALNAGIQAWNEAAWTCNSYIQFILTDPEPDIKRDFTTEGTNKNAVVWLEDIWGDDEFFYDPNAVALTTITFISDPGADDDGEILDADIEFNGVHQTFSIHPDGEAGKYDIQNTFTHELGHVLGLDHLCYDGSSDPRPVDHRGDPIPDCQPKGNLPDLILDSAMYNYTVPGEITKRYLSQDDIAGICGIYPANEDPGICKPVSFSDHACSCRQLPSKSQPSLFLLLLLFITSIARRKPIFARFLHFFKNQSASSR